MKRPIVLALALLARLVPAAYGQPACTRDLSKGAIVMLSGGGFDLMNPPEVRERMDEFLARVNGAESVRRCSGDRGLAVRILLGQETDHLHQSRWKEACAALAERDASPIVIVGHSNGGAAAVSLSRCLEGKGKTVDLLITADSVPTLDDLGDVYAVPANVKLNINTFVVPNPLTFLVPFPIGRANKREGDLESKSVINIGMNYLLPGAVAHRNAFYDFAGGDKQGDGYARPFVLLDLTLAYLDGAGEPELVRSAVEKSDALAAAAGIGISVKAEGVDVQLPKK